MVQKSEHSLVMSFVFRDSLRLQSYQDVTGERFTSKLMHVLVGRIQILAGCSPEGLGYSLAVVQKPPSVPCHVDLFIRELTK